MWGSSGSIDSGAGGGGGEKGGWARGSGLHDGVGEDEDVVVDDTEYMARVCVSRMSRICV